MRAGILPVMMLVWFFVGHAGGQGGHLSDSHCQDCHLAEKVAPDNASVLVASQEKLCVSCHANAVRLSHPSGFAPKRAFSPDFPLDWKGTLTCSSCHDIHAHEAGLMRSALQGAEFCHACHDQPFFDKMADGGASMTGFAHLDARDSVPGLALDAFTLQCLGCHGEKGEEQQVGIGRNGILNHLGSSMNHPIGVNYERAARRGGYHPVSRLPPEILLPDGNVGCVSCHEGYSTQHGKVVKGRGGSLCLVCHDM